MILSRFSLGFWCKAALSRFSSPLLLTNQTPVDSDDTLVRKAFQRFWKNHVTRFLGFLESDYSEISSAFAFQDGHYTVVLDLRLQVAVSGWFLPKRVDLRVPAFFDYLGEARCFDLEKFHGSECIPIAVPEDASQRLALP